MRESAVWSAVRMWTRADPAAAAAWLTPMASETWTRNAGVRVVEKWLPQAPQEALTWAQEHLPAGEIQDAAIRNGFRSWTQNDMTAASQQLLSMQAGHPRDVAVATLARNVATQEPASAMAWIPQISDAQLRQETMIQAGRGCCPRPEPGRGQTAAVPRA